MQQGVAIQAVRNATVCSVIANEFWRKFGAPKLRARKAEIGRDMSNTDIAAAVETRSGKRTSRQLFEHILHGRREPYISQLVAICDVMEMELESFTATTTPARRPLIQSAKTHTKSRKPYKIARRGPGL